jgi:hypothetical protein
MPSPQKIKGNGWEQTVAKYLTDLYKESFVRVPHSGAYLGGSNRGRRSQLDEGQIRNFKGDIIPGISFTRFNCECKFYQDFPFHQILQGSCKTLDQWIEQLMQTADPGDCNMLFMKFNRKGSFTAVPHSSLWNLSLNHLTYSSLTHGIWYIFDFDKFFQLNHGTVRRLASS